MILVEPPVPSRLTRGSRPRENKDHNEYQSGPDGRVL